METTDIILLLAHLAIFPICVTIGMLATKDGHKSKSRR